MTSAPFQTGITTLACMAWIIAQPCSLRHFLLSVDDCRSVSQGVALASPYGRQVQEPVRGHRLHSRRKQYIAVAVDGRYVDIVGYEIGQAGQRNAGLRTCIVCR